MRPADDLYRDARHEHVGRPARTAQHRGRAHLTLHRDDRAIGVDGIEMDIGMGIDEVETGQRAFDRELARGIEAADAVMRPGRRSQHDERDGQHG